jgi:hypothetical protein
MRSNNQRETTKQKKNKITKSTKRMKKKSMSSFFNYYVKPNPKQRLHNYCLETLIYLRIGYRFYDKTCLIFLKNFNKKNRFS